MRGFNAVIVDRTCVLSVTHTSQSVPAAPALTDFQNHPRQSDIGAGACRNASIQAGIADPSYNNLFRVLTQPYPHG